MECLIATPLWEALVTQAYMPTCNDVFVCWSEKLIVINFCLTNIIFQYSNNRKFCQEKIDTFQGGYFLKTCVEKAYTSTCLN